TVMVRSSPAGRAWPASTVRTPLASPTPFIAAHTVTAPAPARATAPTLIPIRAITHPPGGCQVTFEAMPCNAGTRGTTHLSVTSVSTTPTSTLLPLRFFTGLLPYYRAVLVAVLVLVDRRGDPVVVFLGAVRYPFQQVPEHIVDGCHQRPPVIAEVFSLSPPAGAT